MGDDRDSNKAWLMSAPSMIGYLQGAIEADTQTWRRRDDLTPAMTCCWLEARSVLGLPFFLRRWRGPRALCPLTLFPLVKSKCFSDQGIHRCQKPLHSCWRRVIDCSSAPYASGWRTMSRAGRGALRAIGWGKELWSIGEARAKVDRMLSSLAPPAASCQRCQCPLTRTTIITADIDQCFEACSPSEALSAWRCVEVAFQQRYQCSVVSVHRGRKEKTQPAVRGWVRNWWGIELAWVARAILAFTRVTFAVVGQVVYEMLGIAIGGVMQFLGGPYARRSRASMAERFAFPPTVGICLCRISGPLHPVVAVRG